MKLVSRFCGWLIWRGLPHSYLMPLRWYNRWIWRIGAENAIARNRETGAAE
jgi:hypothetical protein